jgi:hypothetical protein
MASAEKYTNNTHNHHTGILPKNYRDSAVTADETKFC